MDERTFSLRCGEKIYRVTVPDGVRFRFAPLNEPGMPEDPQQVIRDALDHPVGSPRVEEMVRPGQKICIVCDDNTRYTPVDLILGELLPRLLEAGIRKEDILIVLALGSHRKMTPDEIRAKLGAEIVAHYRVLNSEFSRKEDLVQVGKSAMGTPINVFRPAMEADFRIGIGNVVPHGCMGWSGGAKILYPGITSENIVSEFHAMQGLSDEILFGMVESPTRLAVEQWTKHIGLHFIVNTVLDRKLNLYRAVSGDFVKAQRQAVKYGEEIYGVRLKERPDVILTAAFPFYIDFWQCGKAVYGPAKVIRPGGELLLLAACTEGIGPHDRMIVNMGLKSGKELLRQRMEAGESGEELLTLAVGVSMGSALRNCRTTVVTDGLTKEQCRSGLMSQCPERELQAALNAAVADAKQRRPDPFLLILPEGGEVLPILS